MPAPLDQRPLPLIHRRDLEFQQMDFRGRTHVLVKDPIGLKYFRLLPFQHRLLQLLDGHRSFEEIDVCLRSEFRDTRFNSDALQRLILDLHQKELILSTRNGLTDETLERRAKARQRKWARLPLSVMFLKLPGWNADPVLRWLTPLCGSLFTPLGAWLSGIVVAASWLFLLIHFDDFQSQLPTANGILGVRSLFILWVVIGAAKGIHELAHAVACRRFGGECHEIGMAFLIFSPCLYCDVSGSWMLARKSQRICVALAGIWIELLISTLCLFLWWHSAPGILNSISLQLFIVTSVSTILFNANPLLRYDGYYILSDLMETPNLQQRGTEAVRHAITRVVFGVKLPRDPFAEHDQFGFYLIYGVCSGLYRWLILFGIGLFLYQVLKPWGLQPLAISYVFLSILASCTAFGIMFWRILMGVKHSRPAALWRVVPVMGVVIAMAIGIWHCPLRSHAVSPVLIEPHRLQHVYAERSGELLETFVTAGDRVQPGDIIAQLEDIGLIQRLVSLRGDEKKQLAELNMARATSNPDLSRLVTEGIQTVGYQIQSQKQQLSRLSIVAPCAGRIVTAPAGGAETTSRSSGASRIEGDPLEAHNRHALIERRTHICSIAPNDEWQAFAWVDQDECQFFSIGQSVEIMLDAYPGERIKGSIESISSSQEDAIPATLSEKYGGALLTQTTRQGESPHSATYRIGILLGSSLCDPRLGMKGSVRYLRSEQSVGEWLTHHFYRTFIAL